MLTWYRELSRGERNTFWGCFGGWALDAFDVQLYSFVLPAIVLTLGIGQAQAGLLATAALIASAVGGWAGGVLADRHGRVRVLQWTVLWYSLFTCLSAVTQGFGQLLVVRSLQGLGFGAEWAAGAVLMGEIIRPRYRGRAVGCVQSAYAVGWFAAAAVSTALLVLFLRRHVQEPALFAGTLRDEARTGARPGPFAIFAPEVRRTTLLASLLALGVQGSSYAIITWLPTFLRTVRHLTATGAGSYVMVVTLGAFCGYICSAYLTDAVGRRRNFLLYALGCWAIDLAYMVLPVGNGAILLLGFPFGFFTQGIYASLGPYFTELFPTRIRATGQSFSYNFGRSIGALLVTAVALLAEVMPLGRAIGAISLCGYALAILATLLLPETRGIALEDAGAPAAADGLPLTVGRR